ncbi:MAG: hypothetical protein VYA30_09875 [Myxococcota bacterium]|nr:hypothetical protein [Myxococcota bacterium]
MALPPLSAADLRADAQIIVTGAVVSEFDRVVSIGQDNTASNRELILVVRVDTLEKGTGLRVGQHVYIHAWEAARRPSGWVGDGGHRNLPSEGKTARFYLRQSADGRLSLLSPNGSELIDSHVPKSSR